MAVIFCSGVFQVSPSTPGVRLPVFSVTRLTAGALTRHARVITRQHSLLASSCTGYAIGAPYNARSSYEEHIRFITFHSCTMHRLGSASSPVGVLSASGELGTPDPPTYLLVKHLSIFRLFSSTTFSSNSPSLPIHSSPLPPNLFLPAVISSPHAFEAVLTDAATLSQAHLI